MIRTLPARARTAAILAAVLIFTAVIYWPGLRGPFLLDDPYALQEIGQWLDGKQSFWNVLFGNISLLMHRSLSMASFAFNAWLGGDTTFSLKLGNLLHHLAAAPLIYMLVRRMFLHDDALSGRAWLFAVLVAALWLLHPLHVSTVLYIVQRMAQVATLCCLLGMWMYMAVRDRMQAGTLSNTRGLLLIFLGIPALTFLAIQGKQNGAVLPVLCLVLEWAYYREPRPRALWVFFVATVVLPALALTAGLVMHVDTIFGGYALYDFNLVERLLSEARAMWVYVSDTLLPYPPGMGIYGDDFVVSRGLLSPPSTLVSILALLAMSGAAFLLRRRMPSLFAGWFIFLVGHSVESSILPLEIYYEHRNYLPSIGLLICAITLIHAFLKFLGSRGVETARIGAVLGVGAIAVLAFQTGGRVHVWQRLDTILSSSVAAHPESTHANFAYLNALIASKKFDDAERVLLPLTRSPNPQLRAHAMMYKLNVDCVLLGDASPEELHQALALLPGANITLTHSQALGGLVEKAETRPNACGRLDFLVLAREVQGVADRSLQPADSFTRYTTRHQAARMYAAGGDYANALTQARLAWQPSTPAEYSALLVRMLVIQGRFDQADQVLDQAAARSRSFDQVDQAGLADLRNLVEQARKTRSPAPASAH